MPLLDLDLYRKEIIVADAPRVRVSVIDAGRADAPQAMLFLHGFGGEAMQWRKQLTAFADEARVVAPDLRGHGLSDHPATNYSTAEHLADIERVVAALNLPPKFILLGHSFGGALAAAYAVKHSERVERLVLVGTSVSFQLNPLLKLALKLPVAIGEPIRRMFPRALAAPAYVLKAMHAHALATFEGAKIFPQLKTPLLLIFGHRDIVFSQAAYDAVARLVAGARVEKIPVAAHLVHLERPEAVNRAIARFVKGAGVSWREGRAPEQIDLLRQRPWLKHYEANVPYTLAYPAQPLDRFLDSAARRYPRKHAIIFFDHALSYRALNDAANRFANALIGLGVKKGDRVALLLPNSPQMVIAYYGALKAGAIAVSLNPLFSAAELELLLQDSGAETIVTLSLFYNLVQAVKPKTALTRVIVTNIKEYFSPLRRALFTIVREAREGHRIDLGDDANAFAFQDLLARASNESPAIDTLPEDIALIQYSSGTTELPKGVMLTHANLVANTVQVRHWTTDIREGRESIVGVLPFSHSYGMT
ncbi:MAG: alpha/beta fold hydrolase, partial [Chloroflexi bacterium]|nr:alpha/beta fold hydrolase [Chloroflexota bacterium]